MSKPFDATLKEMAQDCPDGVLAAFDAPPPLPVRVLNVDLSTVTTAADLVLGLGQPLQEAVHIEFQASAAEDLHRDTLAYNALLFRRLRVPVHSIVILLRPQARHPNVTGNIRYESRPNRGKLEFAYEVIPLWERPAEQLLNGSLGLVPLAPLGRLPPGLSLEQGLAQVIGRLVARLEREAAPSARTKLLTAAYVLTGLRIDRSITQTLFRGARAMRESDSYQGILDEGRAEGAHAQQLKSLLKLGEARFGTPAPKEAAAALKRLHLEQLEALALQVLRVASWAELLPQARKPARRKKSTS